MKIQLMSDLHFEFGWKMYLTNEPDITLVLAGDIDARPYFLEEFIRHACTNRKQVIMVAGNHEFYGNWYEDVIHNLITLEMDIDNFKLLENDGIVMDDILFLGATLWSDPDWGVFKEIADHTEIVYKGHRLLDSDIREMNRETKQFLKGHLCEANEKRLTDRYNKVVVVTHFGPDPALMNPKWLAYNRTNTYFWATGLQDTFKYVDHWFFGHTHDPTDMVIDDCRFTCNPGGYRWPGGAGRENWNFDEMLILDI